MNLKTSEKTVLELLRLALLNEKPKISWEDITDEVWTEVYALSIQQGVQAIVFDGIIQLPQALYPSEELLLQWAVNVKMTEQKHDYYCETICELNDLFAKDGIEMLLLKGTCVSSYYPIPAHREYGDIDIYLFNIEDDPEKTEQSLRKIFMLEDKSTDNLFFKNIPIENHLTFLNTQRTRTLVDKGREELERGVEEHLYDLLNAEDNYYVSLANKKKIRVPSPTFNFLYLTYHTGLHLPRGIVLRHLCDWGCFLSANKGRYDEKQVESFLHNSKFGKIACLMSQMAITYLGLPKQFVPPIHIEKRNKRLEQRILLDILNPFPRITLYKKNNLIIWKIRRFLSGHWKYKLVHGDHLLKRLCRSFLWRLPKIFSPNIEI